MIFDQPTHIQQQGSAIFLAVVEGQGGGAQAVAVGADIAFDRQGIECGQHVFEGILVDVDSVIVNGHAALGEGVDAQGVEPAVIATDPGLAGFHRELMGLWIKPPEQPIRAILNGRADPFIIDGLRHRDLFEDVEEGGALRCRGMTGGRHKRSRPGGDGL